MIKFVNSTSLHILLTLFFVEIYLNCLKEVEYVGIDEAIWEDPQIVPQCLSSQLKTCLFRGCSGRKSELQFAEYVMQNSKVLRTMTVHGASSIDWNAKHEMIKKLAVCPRSSSSCKLIFD
jgi:hypothetical protein